MEVRAELRQICEERILKNGDSLGSSDVQKEDPEDSPSQTREQRMRVMGDALAMEGIEDTTESDDDEEGGAYSQEGCILNVELVSFGFEAGPRLAADEATKIFDCRAVVNPSKLSRKGRTGLDKRLRDEVLQSPGCESFITECMQVIRDTIQSTSPEGAGSERTLVFGFGCAAGHHRSVSIAETILTRLLRLAKDQSKIAAKQDAPSESLVSDGFEGLRIETRHMNITGPLSH